MCTALPDHIVALDIDAELWEQCFTVAPLVLVGTRDASGAADLAPKHMVTPMGWGNYFGFVCTPRHGTYRNIQRSGEFTVSYPRPSQLLYTSLAAAPRCGDDEKPSLLALPTVPATRVDGVFIEDAYLFLECEHFKTVDGFGENSLITGEIVAAYAHTDALRSSEWDDQELIHDAPLLAYLQPGRFASIDRSYSFPFPAGMKK
jgi:flavin reductase (DIM6/NTAB) family NADH-FMN oxidoreductase RutF